MKAPISKPVNETQRVFKELCERGGGVRRGPARGKVLELLRDSGQAVNKIATREMADHLAAFPTANPWHVCFAVGLSWGRLAKMELAFTEAVVNVLTSWNAADLRRAQSYHMERGPEPIGQLLTGPTFFLAKSFCQHRCPRHSSNLSALRNGGSARF
jgi:hypothetical protein